VIIVVVSVDGNKILLVVLVGAMAQAVSSGLSTRKPGLAPGSAQVGFMVDRMALEQVYLRVLRISPVNIVPPWLRNHIIVSYIIWRMKKCPLVAAGQGHILTRTT
jgi:hypothetical protein